MKITKIVFKISVIIFIFCNAFFLIYNIWVSKFLKILFIISLIILLLSSIYSFIYIYISLDLNIYFINNLKLYKLTYRLFIFTEVILITISSGSKIIMNYNKDYLDTFLNNCPFTLKKNESNFVGHTCELYNIYNNSRYKYQYICSYNASKDFKSEKTKDGHEKIQCVFKKHNISSSDIITNFINKYENNSMNVSEFFYCSRIDMPIKDENYNEYCNKEFNLFISFNVIEFFLSISFFAQFESFKKLAKYISKTREELLQIAIINNDLKADYSTDNDDDNANDISFNEEEDKNIIVEKHEINEINFNIKNLFGNEEKQKKLKNE